MILKETANNPFRVLGLYQDCTLKQQTANAGRLRAFAMVNRQESLPADLTKLYGEMLRSTESLKAAEDSLNNANERLRAALLWWPEPTEEWMTTVMNEIQTAAPFHRIVGNMPLSALSQPDQQRDMKVLLMKLQVCILHEKWAELASTFEQIIKSLDVLKELTHCQAASADGSSLQQYLYGILEQNDVDIHTVSYSQQIRQLIDTGREVNCFYDMQLLYYKLEEVTEDQKLLESLSGQIVNWLVRVMHKAPCPEEEFKNICQALRDSFRCSHTALATLSALNRNIFHPYTSPDDNVFGQNLSLHTNDTDNSDIWIGCLFYFVILPFFGIVIRTCSNLFSPSDADKQEHNSRYSVPPPSYQPLEPVPSKIDEKLLQRIHEISKEKADERAKEWDQDIQVPPPPKIDIPEPIQKPPHYKPVEPPAPSIDEETLQRINQKVIESVVEEQNK